MSKILHWVKLESLRAFRSRLLAVIAFAVISVAVCESARASETAPPRSRQPFVESEIAEDASVDESPDGVIPPDGVVITSDEPSDLEIADSEQDNDEPGDGETEQVNPAPAEAAEATNCACGADNSADCSCVDCSCRPPGDLRNKLWWTYELLAWSTKTGEVPPLVTGGGNGVIGNPGTRILLDDLDFASDPRGGLRFTSGYQLGPDPYSAFELSWFLLNRQFQGLTYASNGSILGRPYIDAVSELPAVTLAAAPGMATGEIVTWTQVALTGVEINLLRAKRWSEVGHISLLGGFRYLRLVDKLHIDEEFLVAPNVPGFGGSYVDVFDQFRTSNNFFGGQLGLDFGRRLGRFSLDVRTKFALGMMSESATIEGSTNVKSGAGGRRHYEGGLYALQTNIGSYQQNAFAFVPELNVDGNFQLTNRIRLLVGYTLLWVNTVARAGEQIDPTINTSVFPILNGDGPLVRPARPKFDFVESDFWAQGVNLGFELRF